LLFRRDSYTNSAMAESFDQSLRRAMEWLGHVVEHLIGSAKKARVQVESRTGMQPVLSIESQLPYERTKDLIDASIKRMMENALPNLEGHAALDIGEGPVLYASRLLGARAATAISYDIRSASAETQGDASRGFVVRGKPARLPFPANRFAYVIGRLASAFQGDVVRAATEMGRVMSQGGQGVLIDFHPFGLFAKRGAGRLKSAESNLRRFEDYYALMRKSGLRIVDLREIFIDEQVRQMFRNEEIAAYRSLKGTPLLAFFFLYKPRGQRQPESK